MSGRTPRCDHITGVLIHLHWLKVEQRIIYKILILTYKSFVDLSAPLYLRELVKKKNKSANTRLADDSLLLVPPINKGSSHTFFERSFIYTAPTELNKLDGRIRKITNIDSFKREIKTTLFLSYFDLQLYTIVLAFCMFLDITVYFMLLLCCIYINFDYGIAFQVY